MSNVRHGNNGRAGVGFILVLVGAALLIKNLNIYFVPNWLFTWPTLIILCGLYSGIRCGFKGSNWLILLAIGGFFLLDDFYPEVTDEPFFWPALIILTGLVFLLRAGKPQRKSTIDDQGATEPVSGFTVGVTVPSAPENTSMADSEDYLQISSIFSGVNRIILSKNFKGGDITCIFGGVEIDLTQADINGRVAIRVDEIFGGMKLRIPSNWIVENRVSGAFHGIEDKRNKNIAAVTPDSTKVLVLQGSCVFGGIEIKSY